MKFRVFKQLVGKVSKNVNKKLLGTVTKVRKNLEKHWCDLVSWNEDHDLAIDEDGNEYLVVEDKDGLHILDFDGLVLRDMLDVEDFIDTVAEVRHYGSMSLEDDFELNGILVYNLMKYFSISIA